MAVRAATTTIAAPARSATLWDWGRHTGPAQRIRVAAGPEAGSQAGALEASDARASVVPGPPPKAVQYAEQTREGCSVSGPETRWALRWRSPARAVGDVLIHIAANAANYDDSPLGDFIYVGEWRVRGEGGAAPP